MPFKKTLTRGLLGVLGAACAAHATSAAAVDFQVGGETLKVENLFTIGGAWRMQERDPTLIGKSSYYALTHPQSGAGADPSRVGLCFTRTSQSTSTNPDSNQNNNTLTDGVVPEGCATSGGDAANGAFVRAPGSFSPNGDEGDLNFAKGDLVNAVAKLLTDVNYSWHDYNFFVRGVAFFDAQYMGTVGGDFQEFHPDTTLQAEFSDLSHAAKREVGVDYDILDYNIGHVFMPFGHAVALKVGDQVLNWGESSLLALNSLNTINPPDARRLNIPGLDLKEAFRPIGMVTLDTDIIEDISVQGFYTYDWKPLLIDPVGSFYSQSDTLGDGGDYAMLSFAKQPDDPGFAVNDPRYPAGRRGYYRPIDTCSSSTTCTDTLGLLGSTASRTVFRDHALEKDREPNGGDYGIALKTFLESVNNGTELAFYYANYDSRLPVVSAMSALDSCIGDNGNAAALTLATDCQLGTPGTPAGKEPIPVDTMRLLVEYPENIHLYGVSFNTTVGDYAISGEYAYRPNLPVQVDTVDLTYTALQPAFPAQDVAIPGVGTIPGRQSAFPTFLTRYRGYACTSDADCIQPNSYIAGYERLHVGQANLTVLRLIGGDNPLAASQMTFLLEMGMQRVFDMPAIGQLQLEGTGSDTHISGGADGSAGIDPPAVAGNARDPLTRQNPTANTDYKAYGTSESYGFRFINLNRWEDAFHGINLESLAIIRDDVKGTSPGIGTNFSEGRKQYNLGLRFDYLSTWSGEVRYTWYMGKHDALRDRDNVFVTVGYQF